MGLGWGLDRRFGFDLTTLVRLNLYVFVPAFLFVRVYQSPSGGALATRVTLFTILVISALGALTSAVARVKGATNARRDALRLSTMFYNCGNFGLPVVTLAFPDTGPSVHIWVLMTMNIATFSMGAFLAGGGARQRPWALLGRVARMPSIVAIAVALSLRGLHVPVDTWVWLWAPASFLADALVAFALLTLGIQLSQTKPPPLRGDLAWGLGIRLLGGPCIAAGLCLLFNFPPLTTGILIIGAAGPTAINTALLAHEFQADTRFASAAVFYSSLLSVITAPLTLMVVRRALEIGG